MQRRSLFQFFTERRLDKREIEKLLSNAFQTSNVSSLLDEDDSEVSYSYYHIAGDFQTSIDLYIDEKLALEKHIGTDTDLGMLISEQLKERVLVSDNNINPYTWLLIKNSKVYEVEQVEKEDESMVLRRENTQPIS